MKRLLNAFLVGFWWFAGGLMLGVGLGGFIGASNITGNSVVVGCGLMFTVIGFVVLPSNRD